MRNAQFRPILVLMMIAVIAACKKSSKDSTEATVTNPVIVTTVGAGVPDVYKKIYGASSITSDGTYLTIKTNGLPDHKSAYYATNNTLYENFVGVTFGGYTFNKNPNSMASQNYTFKIPLNPTVAATHASTPMGPIGVAINGVPLYNQYAGGGAALSGEIVSFDQGYGHPDPGSHYHYHVEPIKLTATKGSEALMGFLLDGFPVYGPKENGATVPTASLDAYHGHTSATADFPGGIYHYHFSTDAPYLNGSGFYGTSGTVSY
ncbi:MAG: YHYH protein [Pedobacter sp.]|nr:YHYH protein [Pedobacter sp.]MDQ8053782.1 YHYH protein [Pedobacter sp.]